MTIKNISAALAVGAALLTVGGVAQATIAPPPASAFAKVGDSQANGQSNANAGTLVVDLAGTPSIDALNDALNVHWVLDATPGALVDTVSYQLTLSALGQSWLSEAGVLITNSAGQGIKLRPGFSTNAEGNASFSGSASLAALNMAFNVGTDGKLNFQFYEHYDDVASGVDAVFTAGSITLGGVAVTAVPEPASYGLMALGLLGMAAVLRRRGRTG
jgi:hypothetical protein